MAVGVGSRQPDKYLAVPTTIFWSDRCVDSWKLHFSTVACAAAQKKAAAQATVEKDTFSNIHAPCARCMDVWGGTTCAPPGYLAVVHVFGGPAWGPQSLFMSAFSWR